MDYRIEQLRYLLREDPSSRIFFQLGELLRREGEAVQSVKVLESGLERHPRYVAAWVSLGRAQRDLHALEEAEQAFETALEIDRENPVAARLLGETAVERQNWLGAVKAFKLTRALTGGDDELDAQIAMVEERLDEDGRLEQPAKREARSPQRCLEIVSLSADDPFSAASDEAEGDEAMSDVFEIVEASADVAAEDEAPDEPDAGESPAFEEAVEIEAAEEDELDGIETEVEEETTDFEPDAALAVDESSVGAWSATMKAAGVSGEEAWREPTDELLVSEDEASTGVASWSEPTAAAVAVEIFPDAPVEAEEEVEEESSSGEAPAEVAGGTEEGPEGVGVGPGEVRDDEVPPVERHTFDPIEVTHPDVVEQRAAEAGAEFEADESPVSEADEPPVEEVHAPAEEPTDDELPPSEDRGFESVEATRPIEVEPEILDGGPPSAPAVEETGMPSSETAEKRHELDHGVPLPTMTLAKLALDQGDRPLAMATLESLIERDPSNVEATALLGELQAHEEKVANTRLQAAQATTKVAALQGWLDAVRLAAERRVP